MDLDRVSSTGLRRAVAAAAAVAAAVLVVWPTGFVMAGLAGAVAAAAVRFSSGRPSAAANHRAQAQVAVLCDLWAAGLDSGLPVGGALSAALEATDLTRCGSVGSDTTIGRLVRVAGLLQLGADSVRSWAPADGDPQLVPIAAAARRSQLAGADIATSIREQARAVRRSASGQAQRRAGRAGVLMTAPLALCFLPSFICLGLAPVVIALVGTLDIGR